MGAMRVEVDVLSSVFDGAIAQNAQLDFNAQVPIAIGAPFGSCRSRIKAVILVTEENLSWELWVWSKAARAGASYDVDSWRGRWTFAAGDAVTSASDTRYRYYVDGNDIAYEDQDATDRITDFSYGLLHLSLIPRGAAHVIHKKILLKLILEPEGFTS